MSKSETTITRLQFGTQNPKIAELDKKLFESKTKLTETEEEIEKIKNEISEILKLDHLEKRKTWKNSKFLFKTVEVAEYANCNIEICADFFGACKPRKITIQVSEININSDLPTKIKTTAIEKFVEILNITVMGSPQLINYDGTTVATNRGISKFYEDERVVDWVTFGASSGQGLQISMRNPFPIDLEISICVVGEPADTSMIGRG